MAKCPYQECIYHQDCPIIDITKKIPEKFDKCSYGKLEKKKK